MKFSLVAALVVVLALSQGSDSASLVKREAPVDVETVIKYFQELSDLLTKTTQDLVEKVKAHELTEKANAYIEEGRAQLQPMSDQIQEQLKPLTDSVQTQLKPLTDSIQPQLEDIWKILIDASKALTN
ncbi:hypothetical protein JZ751_009819 [Albula glossodonta]|uniref:Uncharacterized protein n=1 Tax=Albula glossodonta TaxID=121402 RepID=A0A8T2NWB9_9TELE|nr:hypothetical protein JZ751_009819 [Albula glossodonta]